MSEPGENAGKPPGGAGEGARQSGPPASGAAGPRNWPAYLTIGTITSPHGVQGAVNVFPHSDAPERFQVLERVWLGSGGRPQRQADITKVTTGGRLVVIEFAGVKTREGADALRGTDLLVPVEEAWPLPEGSYYLFELEGLAVYDTAGRLRGTLARVYPGPANDCYGIGETGSGRETLIAAVRSVVKEVDKARARMVVEWPEEY